jgi:hypothetical protein
MIWTLGLLLLASIANAQTFKACNSIFDNNWGAPSPLPVGYTVPVTMNVIAGPVSGDGSGTLEVKEAILGLSCKSLFSSCYYDSMQQNHNVSYVGDTSIDFNTCTNVKWLSSNPLGGETGAVKFWPMPGLSLKENTRCSFRFRLRLLGMTPGAQPDKVCEANVMYGTCNNGLDTASGAPTQTYITPSCSAPGPTPPGILPR